LICSVPDYARPRQAQIVIPIAEKIAFILIERAWIPAPSTLLRMKAVIRELEIRELERKKEKGKGIFRLIGE
jgi:hypothetical protein